MKIERFVVGMIGTNCYLVVNEETKQMVIIDPGAVTGELLGHIKTSEYKPVAILLTHGHFDHILGIDGILKEYQVPVYAQEDEKDVLENVQINLSGTAGSGYTYNDAIYVKDGQILELAGIKFKVMHTPGHTKGGCCYYVEDEGVLFSGDTLFQASVGRTDFPTSSMSDLIRGIKDKLLVLPDETAVYPGHMSETTIGYEKMHNPFI